MINYELLTINNEWMSSEEMGNYLKNHCIITVHLL
jgi:hypothetical protein